MTKRSFREKAAILALLPALAVAAPANDYGSIGYGGPVFREARIDDGWSEARFTNNYGSISSYSSPYGHEYDHMRSKAKRRASRERARENMNQHYRHDKVAANEGKPRSYRSELQEGHLRISGSRGMSQDEAMRSTLPGNQGFPSTPEQKLPPIPESTTPVGVGDTIYYYADCEYFLYQGSELVKVEPPEGAMVFDLADSARQFVENGSTRFECGGAVYKNVLLQGSLVYQMIRSTN